jgi:two-component system cell cycle sensor histidine kinase/response regulator CckA
MVRRALVEVGFRVIECANGQEALEQVLTGADRLDAVLTDLAMPNLGGRELAERIHQDRPDLPVVYMSGYTGDIVARRGLLEPGIPFLEKPLSPSALARTMQQVLEEARQTVVGSRLD